MGIHPESYRLITMPQFLGYTGHISAICNGAACECMLVKTPFSYDKILIVFHGNHHADRYTVCTKRDERVQTNGRLSSKIELRGKHTTTHGKVSRRLLPEFKAV